MDSIVLQLQSEAVDSNTSIVQLLRKALIIASKLNLTDIEKWINNELNGYEDIDDIPSYRNVSCEIKAYNPFNGIWMPIIFESEKEAELFNSKKISQKITELDKIDTENKNSTLHIQIPDSISNNLMKNSDLPSKPVLLVPASSVRGIIESVRNIILDWTLQLEREGILGEGLRFNIKEKIAADSSNNIHIENFQGVLGNISNSTVVQSNLQEISKGDITSLKKYLKETIKLEDDDITELEKAISEDSVPVDKNKLGKSVSSWLGKMVSKAASGIGNLTISTAANVLGQVIIKYYGL